MIILVLKSTLPNAWCSISILSSISKELPSLHSKVVFIGTVVFWKVYSVTTPIIIPTKSSYNKCIQNSDQKKKRWRVRRREEGRKEREWGWLKVDSTEIFSVLIAWLIVWHFVPMAWLTEWLSLGGRTDGRTEWPWGVRAWVACATNNSPDSLIWKTQKNLC